MEEAGCCSCFVQSKCDLTALLIPFIASSSASDTSDEWSIILVISASLD